MAHKLPQRSFTPKNLTYKQLEDITNNFSEDHKIGSGGFGEVYKGVLRTGETIAVKKLYDWLNIDVVEFEKEFNNLMRVEHGNIVRLVGYCYETRYEHIEMQGKYVFGERIKRALCFEYLEHGSLDQHLSDESCGLDWHMRFTIIKGVCEGLNYLHKDNIYHLDMKPANILLDENMMPKIADLGSSTLFKSTQTYTTENIVGTPRYMPPEYIDNGKISKKFDVFSLGVIIIDIMTGPLGYTTCYGMPPQQFVELVHENWMKRFHIMSQRTSYEADSLEVKMCIEMALRCIDADRNKRPTVAEVNDMLSMLDTSKNKVVETTKFRSRSTRFKNKSKNSPTNPLVKNLQSRRLPLKTESRRRNIKARLLVPRVTPVAWASLLDVFYLFFFIFCESSDSEVRHVDTDSTKRPTVQEVVDKLNEMDTLEKKLTQSSESEEPRVDIDPLELRFPFELNKQISSVLQLTNKSDDFVAFRVKADHQSKYFARPDKGVMPPRSKRYVVATMQAQEAAPPGMQGSDMFIVQYCTTASDDGLTPGGNTDESAFETEGEVKLPVVYVV